jgi:hypothetical protein
MVVVLATVTFAAAVVPNVTLLSIEYWGPSTVSSGIAAARIDRMWTIALQRGSWG